MAVGSGRRPEGRNQGDGRESLLAWLHSSMAALTLSERKVAEVVTKDPSAVIYGSVTELAAAASVGETTVLRFARKLGYSSYQRFKMDLARDIFVEDRSGAAEGNEKPSLPSDDVLTRATTENQQVIVDTLRLLDRTDFERAVQLLRSAREVHFYGAGHSGLTAQDAQRRFWRMGFPVRAFVDSHFQLMDAATLTPQDVAVGLSVSGSARDVVECLSLARQRGAATLAITGYRRSPITRSADLVLVTATREMPLESGSFTSKIGQLHVLDLLLRRLVETRPEEVRRHQEETGKAISDKFY